MIPAARAAHRRRQTARARATLARVKPRTPPSRLLPCPVCRAEVRRFDAVFSVIDPGDDRVTLQPCGHTFERREHPDWLATFASEGE